MSLKVIYVTRHGFRSNWVVERETGVYHSSIPSPTGIPSDPALASHGALQAQELAEKLVTLDPPIERFYSSPWYRCIQTLYPTLEKLSSPPIPNNSSSASPELKVRCDPGLGEWFGLASFSHPSPAPPAVLKRLFPRYYDEEYKPIIIPGTKGEGIEDLHERAAYTLHRIIEQCNKEGTGSILICSHAATVIAIGRVLTGWMPEDVGVEDFGAWTCGLSKFVRRDERSKSIIKQDEGRKLGQNEDSVPDWQGLGTPIPKVNWRGGRGVMAGWDCEINGDCSFLSGGEERGWRFSGDESFLNSSKDDVTLDAGAGLGVQVVGRKKSEKSLNTRMREAKGGGPRM